MLGLAVMLITTVGCVYIGGRIFRVGILMQGKGASVRDSALDHARVTHSPEIGRIRSYTQAAAVAFCINCSYAHRECDKSWQ